MWSVRPSPASHFRFAEYADEHTLIPKNTSLVVARVPLAQKAKKHWHPSEDKQPTAASGSTASVTSGSQRSGAGKEHGGDQPQLADLSRMTGTEEDKINAMMIQSSLDYDPSK